MTDVKQQATRSWNVFTEPSLNPPRLQTATLAGPDVLLQVTVHFYDIVTLVTLVTFVTVASCGFSYKCHVQRYSELHWFKTTGI